MDRTAWAAVIVSALGLVFWYTYMAKQVPPPAVISGASVQASPSSAPVVPPAASTSAAPAANASPSPAATVAPTFAETHETLRNSDVEIQLTNKGGAISEVTLLNQRAIDGPVVLNAGNQTPIAANVSDPASPSLPEYKATRQGDVVQYEYASPQGLTIRKKFSFAAPNEKKDNYLIQLDLDEINNGAQPISNGGYYLTLGTAAPIHPKDLPSYTRLVWCLDTKGKGVDTTWFSASSGFLGLGAVGTRPQQSLYQQSVPNAEWGAVSSQFFATIIVPLNGRADSVWARRFDIPSEKPLWGIEGAVHMPSANIGPGQTASAHFEIYAGPKLYHKLARLEHNEAEIMNFGIFKLVSQFLLNFMNWLHSIVGSYAIAILALTTVIRLVLWPVQAKANKSMKQTAALGPRMQELKEKYKDDPTRMNSEVMKLYKQYGINPVGGCLPMVIQIPIFFGLYTMLGQAVELRNERFLWVPDLSQPDTVAHLFGYPINILPLCMAATQVWLMQMTPKTGDATQRRIMMFTPLIFMFICYNFAAALALYYTAQNLFSILQFYQTRNQPMPALTKIAPAGKGGRK